ncbi:MAG: tRNA pseudouridine(13) synthase TruD [Promethearchaeota archaeon]
MLKDYSVESIIGVHGFNTPQFKGLGGMIKQRNKDFIVREIPPSGKPIFDGSEIGKDLGGMFIHCVLWKTGIDTFSAIRKLSSSWKVAENDFGFAGLKDAAAETYQRISIWNIDKMCINNTNFPNIKVFHPIRQKFAIKIGDLLGNFFEVIIRNNQQKWNKEEWERFKVYLESNGVLNFYGSQRFGTKRPILHIIGKFLLQEKYSDAITKYLGETSPLENERITKLRQEYQNTHSYEKLRSEFPYSYRIEKMLLRGLIRYHSAKRIILNLPKSFLKLAISAYQSYLFNKILSYLNETYFPLPSDIFIPLPGYRTIQEQSSDEIWDKLVVLLEEDSLDLQSFRHEQLNLRSKGSLRKAIVFPSEFNYFPMDIQEKGIKVTFSLPKGSYGTIVIREIMKKEIC